MEPLEITIKVTPEQLQKAMEKGAKEGLKNLEYIVQAELHKIITKHLKKNLGNLEELIFEAVKQVDWQKIIKDLIESGLQPGGYYG